jgi:MFS family permease
VPGDHARKPSATPRPPGSALPGSAFALFWSASTLGAFGVAITGVAFQVLIVTVLDATPLEIGVLSSLGVVPYIFLGLIVGALMDRWRRKPVLVFASVGRALVLGAIPVLLLLDVFEFWSLAAVVVLVGVLTLFSDSASQPFLPRIVLRGSLVTANARLSQGTTVAGTTGPALGGAILSLLGASVTFILDAMLNLVSALLVSRIRVDEPGPGPRADGRHLGHDIADGMRFTYRHRTLAPMALSIHVWFLGHSIAVTVFGVFVLRELGLDPLAFGIAIAFAGLGGFLGAVVAPRVGQRLGAGHAVLLGRALAMLPWTALALAPLASSAGTVAVATMVAAAQFVYGLSMGIEDANEMGYRQAAAPDAMQGRLNSTIRTINRVVFFVGALTSGVLATYLGYRVTLGIAAVVFLASAIVIAVSPFRTARHGDEP